MGLMWDEKNTDDLSVFCAALHGHPTKAGVIRQAVAEFMARELAKDEQLRIRFAEIKRQRHVAASRGLRVVK